MSVATSKAIRAARSKLDDTIALVRKGDFLQIERVCPETRKSISIVAYRNTGDKELFQKQINRMFEDACDALKEGEVIRVSITE